MNRGRFLSLTLAALASTLIANPASARGVKVKSSGGSSSSSSSGSTTSGGSTGSGSSGGSKSGNGTTVVPTGSSNNSSGGKEDCTLIADPGRRHDCAVKQIGR